MIVFPDSSSHVLDHATPVVPVELDGRLYRGLALEAKHKWPGFEAACQDGRAREQLCAETPRALAWPRGADQIVLIVPVADGRPDSTARERLKSTRIAIASLGAIGPAAAKAGRRSVGLPPLRCSPEGPAPAALMTWLAETVIDFPHIDWHIYWWPRAGFETPEMRSVLGDLMERS